MKRHSELVELMDDPNCNPRLLKHTYQLFPIVNRLFSQWKKIYQLEIKPHLTDSQRIYTLLDIGSGLMDNSLYVQKLAKNDGYQIEITGIDPNPMLIELIDEVKQPSQVHFRSCFIHEIPKTESYDFVISNHLLHHLTPAEITDLLDEIRTRTQIKSLMIDIHRSRFAWIFFGCIMFPFRFNSFIQRDGLTSIKRSYTPAEMSKIASDFWRIRKFFPYRYALIYDKN